MKTLMNHTNEKDHEQSESEQSDSGEEWQPFYFDLIKFKPKVRSKRTEFKQFSEHLDQLSDLKKKEEKKFSTFLSLSDEESDRKPERIRKATGEFGRWSNSIKRKLKSNQSQLDSMDDESQEDLLNASESPEIDEYVQETIDKRYRNV